MGVVMEVTHPQRYNVWYLATCSKGIGVNLERSHALLPAEREEGKGASNSLTTLDLNNMDTDNGCIINAQ